MHPSISSSSRSLYLQTMMVLLMQILILSATALLAARTHLIVSTIMGFVALVLLQFGLLFAILSSRNHILLSLLLFALFSIVNGLMFAPLLQSATYRRNSITALIMTAVVFVVMTLYALLVPASWTPRGRGLFVALLALIAASLVQLALALAGFSVNWLSRILGVVGVVLFSLFIVADTRQILDHHPIEKNPVLHALRLYLDLLNLYDSILNLQR